GAINVGQISASDPEGKDLTFKLTGSNDIEISETGYLKFITAPDFETKSEYTATITATDPAGNATELDTVLTIRDVNEAPVFTSDTAFNFDENATSAITTITTTDEDTDSVVTYQITGGTDGARFAVNSTTGVLTFSGFIPDFENPLFSNDNDYEVTVTASDGTNTTDQTIIVSVKDLNDNAPVFTSDNALTFNENRTAVTTLATTDADADSTVSYSITGGADANSFAVTTDGVLTISGTDYESGRISYEVIVTANDGANTTIQTITVAIIDTNDNAPVFTSTASPTIDENETFVTTLVTTDADTDSTVSYSITGGADAASFEVSTLGTLALINEADYESPSDANTDNIYNVTVTANDGVNSTPQDITVTVNNLNDERPIVTSPTQFVFEVPENFPLRTKIPGTDITGYDPDGIEIEVCSHATLDGATNKNGVTTAGDFFADGVNACHLVFGSEAVIDYESGIKQYRTLISIYEKDYAAFSAPIIFTVNITDVNEAPTITSTTTEYNAAENQTTIDEGTISAADQDANDTLTFSVSGDVLTIDAETGILSFVTAPDFETTTSITATVTVTDAAGLTDTQDVTVTVTDVNDNAPVFTSDTAFNFDENATSAITTITTTDEDTDSVVTYQITGGTDGARFAVNSTTGVLTFSGFIPDFENPLFSNDNDYEVTVTAYDGVNEASQAITVTVNNLNDERPIITSPTQFVFEVPENFPLQTKIPGIDITGYDPDGNKLRACQQSNPDGLTPNTGLMVGSQRPMSATQTCDLLFGSQANTDYESGPKSFKIVVQILDKNKPVTGRTGNNNVSEPQLITVNITDVNDNPPVFAD
ncbi:cadherin repeat domain-containing protein, partial [Gammaproteobacteria bacterium]|nr:cadherin repeat domain-containing protein [Gammaproteobacteria bacterium]